MAITNLSALDLKACRLAQAWGLPTTPAATYCPVSPCPRPDCGGSVMALGDEERRCLLCARADDDTTGEYTAEAGVSELMS